MQGKEIGYAKKKHCPYFRDSFSDRFSDVRLFEPLGELRTSEIKAMLNG